MAFAKSDRIAHIATSSHWSALVMTFCFLEGTIQGHHAKLSVEKLEICIKGGLPDTTTTAPKRETDMNPHEEPSQLSHATQKTNEGTHWKTAWAQCHTVHIST